MMEKVLFETGARITKDSWPCYFCGKLICNIPYMFFEILYDGRRIERRAHCRCFNAAKRKNDLKKSKVGD